MRASAARYLLGFGVVLAAVLSLVAPAAAGDDQTVPWRLAADRLEHRSHPPQVEASGDVRLERSRPGRPPLVIRAQRLRHRLDRNTVHAEGEVMVESGDQRLAADQVDLDLESQTGLVTAARLYLPETNLTLTGRQAEKTGEYTYRFQEATLSTCPPPADGERQAWRLLARRAELTLEGYARLHAVTLQVKEVPVFYSPFLVVPAKTTRASGFLFPEFSNSSRDGSGILAPYFVDLSPSADLTLYPGYLERRGPLAGLEFRWLLDDDSRGTFRATFLHDTRPDTADDDFAGDGYLRATRDRYWLRAKADHAIDQRTSLHYDLDLVSDRDFLREYRQGPLGFATDQRLFTANHHRDLQEPTMAVRPSRLAVIRRLAHGFIGIEALSYKDVWDEPVTATQAQALPRLVAGGRRDLGSLLLLWDSEAVQYWRRHGVGESRAGVAPRLEIPLSPWPWLEGALQLGLRQDFYLVQAHGNSTWDHDDTANRTVGTAELRLGTTLVRDFHPSADSFAGRRLRWAGVDHYLHPEIAYRFSAPPSQAELPAVDATDRLLRENLLHWSVDNLFLVDDAGGGRRRLARLRLRQWYDVAEGRRPDVPFRRRPFSDLLLEAEARPLAAISLSLETALSVHGQGVTRTDLAAGYHPGPGDFLTAGYRYERDPDRRFPYFPVTGVSESAASLNLAGGRVFSETWRVEGSISRSLSSDQTVASRLRFLYTPPCWNAEVEYTNDEGESRLALKIALEGLGRIPGIGLTGI